MNKKSCVVLVTLLLCGFVAVQAENLDKNVKRGFDTIRPMDCYGYCKTLSSQEFAGRLTGHEGYTSAAEWAAEKFKEWKLKPLSKREGYLQAYPSPYTIVDDAGMTLLLARNNDDKEEFTCEEVELQIGDDFMPQLFSDSGNLTAEVVFTGWGISAPELGYDDYAGIDTDGKVVMCFRGTPDGKNRDFEEHNHHRHRMNTAKEKGAVGLLYIYEEPLGNPNGDRVEGFLSAIISEEVANRILDERGIKAEDLKADLLKYKKPLSFDLSSKVSFSVESRHFPDGIGYNVVGYVEGSDPELKKECLVIGGHLDHCGYHFGMLFAGAQDNASGSAVVIEMAEAFSKLNKRPKRSVVFVLFGGEEMGLMGSYYFADHLPSPFERVEAMFNFDMTGEGEGTDCGYTPEPPELEQVLRSADEQVTTLRRTWEIKQVGVRSSDYAPFFLQGACCVSFFSNGPHLHYHKPGDTIYRINPDIMADVARLGFLSAYKWANR